MSSEASLLYWINPIHDFICKGVGKSVRHWRGGGGGTQFISLAHPLARYALESLPSENVHIKDL